MSDHDDPRVIEELQALSEAALTSSRSWPDAEVLRHRSVAHRNRRRATSGALALLLVAAVVSVSIVATEPSPPPGPRATSHIEDRIGSAIELTSSHALKIEPSAAASAPVAQAEVGFGIKVLQSLVASSGSSSNQLVSPFSLSEALAMVELGARGETASQLENALGVEALSSSAQAQGWLGLDRRLARTAKQDRVALRDANSLWGQTGFPVLPTFLASLRSEFGAGVWQTDFAGHPTAAANAVNAWVSNATGGKIPALLTPGEVQADVAVLLNAVYFKAPWAIPFASTTQAAFHSPTGDVPTKFVVSSSDGQFHASMGSGLDAVQIPYWDGSANSSAAGKYAALLLMPTKGTLSQFVSGLTPTSLDDIVNGLTSQNVPVTMPVLHLQASHQLIPTMQSLGVQDAFGPGADFSGFSPISTYIAEIKQKATLDVTKWGTVATAATAIGIQMTSSETVSPALIIDHPYLLLIRDTQTGTLLFMSAVENPSART
jgi:serpin B